MTGGVNSPSLTTKNIVLFHLTVLYLIFYVSAQINGRNVIKFFFINVTTSTKGFVKHTQTLCKALIADVVPKEKQTAVHGRSTAISSMGFIFGPIIGGHLIELENGFSCVCCLTSLLFIVNVGLFRSFSNRREGKLPKTEKIYLGGLKNELSKAVIDLFQIDWRKYWEVFTLRFLYSFTVSIYFSNQTMYIQGEYNLSQKYIGYIISFFSIIGGISSMMSGYIKVRFYENDFENLKLLLHLFFLLTICFFSICFSPNLFVLLLLLVPFSFSSALLRIVSMEVILNRSGVNDRGSLAGVANSVMSIGRFVSPLISGIIADIFGESKVMLFAFLPSMIATFLCIKLIHVQKNVMTKSD